MPLDRAHISIAQRVMTVVNPAFAGLLGYAYTFKAAELQDAPAYDAAAQILPLQLWGIGFIGIALMLAAARLVHRRVVFVAGLAWLTIWMVVFAGLFIKVYADGAATFIAWVFPAYVAAACWASMLTLLAREG